MNTLLVLVAAALFEGGVPMGPSGAPQTEPFQLTEEYAADYATAEICAGKPEGVDAIKIGKRAVYRVDGGSVEVQLDEFARRDALDYCWQ